MRSNESVAALPLLSRTPTPGLRSVGLAGLVGVALVVAGCGTGTGDDGPTLDVLAAASLGGVMERVVSEFEAEHPGVRVRLSVAGSPDLVAQVVQGAPADVLATADEATMARVTSDPSLRTSRPQVFATNTPALVVSSDAGPAADAVRSLDDAAAPGVRLVVCDPAVPCGDAAVRLAEAAGVELRPVSEELRVTDVLAKVTGGEADAGIVYATDAAAALAREPGAVRVVDVPEAAAVVNRYPVTVLEDSPEADLAHAFVATLTGPGGRVVLDEAGFGVP
ncbi:molybdenum ABC transporter, periplasmic molybdate-binding protein [Isoptericola variabilis 225]|uniref:Molybdenum ABC transporter, periplasmic molybdate-binding protein n=1 Tax=Isoptericola variabilis (strain 225) TaxID=743718 RepID=F6FQZ3_ISOV2|nr:molybdenum ABC transporter, periplasmic molybdate-binding protein [Isoptericola variabilis 225]